MKKKAVFFAKVSNVDILQRNEFYAVDIQILKDLGYEVTISTNPLRIPKADVYVVWWWTWAFIPVLVAKFWRRPIMILGTFDHITTTGELEYYPHRPILHKILIQFALKYSNANLVVSMDQYDYLSKHFRVSGLSYSPHVINTDLYAEGTNKRKDYLLLFCWMHLGNAKRKCVAEAICAINEVNKRVPGIELYIAGEMGDAYPALLELVKRLNAENFIKFLGVVSRDQKISLMQECRIYLQPTLAEGFGVAILEAMSCGAPIITSPVGAVPEVVGDTSLFVNGADVTQIVNATITLLGNESIAANLGMLARKRAVSLYSYDRRKNDIDNTLRCIIEANRSVR